MMKKVGWAVNFGVQTGGLAHSLYKGGMWVCGWLAKKFAVLTCSCANPIVGTAVAVAAIVVAVVTVATA
jgi:hypothetical protein